MSIFRAIHCIVSTEKLKDNWHQTDNSAYMIDTDKNDNIIWSSVNILKIPKSIKISNNWYESELLNDDHLIQQCYESDENLMWTDIKLCREFSKLDCRNSDSVIIMKKSDYAFFEQLLLKQKNLPIILTQ